MQPQMQALKQSGRQPGDAEPVIRVAQRTSIAQRHGATPCPVKRL